MRVNVYIVCGSEKVLKKRSNQGFTLPEMLVAIAIISMMIGMIAIVAGGAQSVAQSVACKANLSSVITGIFNYSSKKNDFFPTVNGSQFDSWEAQIGRYMGMKRAVLQTAGMTDTVSIGWDTTKDQSKIPGASIFRCPSIDGSESEAISYAFNTNAGGVQINQMSTKNVLLFETNGAGDKFGDSPDGTALTTSNPSHGEGAEAMSNFAFVDGSVKEILNTDAAGLEWILP